MFLSFLFRHWKFSFVRNSSCFPDFHVVQSCIESTAFFRGIWFCLAAKSYQNEAVFVYPLGRFSAPVLPTLISPSINTSLRYQIQRMNGNLSGRITSENVSYRLCAELSGAVVVGRLNAVPARSVCAASLPRFRSLAPGRPRPLAGLRARPAVLRVAGAAPWPVGAPAPPFRPPACPLVSPWRGALRAPGGLLGPSWPL